MNDVRIKQSDGTWVSIVGAPGQGNTLNSVSPTTTKGDIIVDNGATSPAASDVRLGVGSDGKVLVADSSQATGLNYATVTPNASATDGDIAIFSGTTGTPMALKDSKLLITSDGAIQSTPSGGNARGTKAIDLQIDRTLPTMVASGANAGILCGTGNTASGDKATVSGGSSNVASGVNAAVAGGFGNTASGGSASVCAGLNNQATGDGSVVSGGDSNTSSGVDSTVGGGSNNLASQSYAGVGSGFSNTSSGTDSAVSGGSHNSASADHCAVPGGIWGSSRLYGQIAHASGRFANPGDAQESELIWRITTTDATSGVEAFLDGAAIRAVIPTNTTWAFNIITLARSSTGICASFETKGCLQNNGGAVSLVAANTQAVICDGTGGTFGVTGNLVISADNVNKSLKIAATGSVGTLIRWTSHARMVEVNY